MLTQMKEKTRKKMKKSMKKTAEKRKTTQAIQSTGMKHMQCPASIQMMHMCTKYTLERL